MRRRVRLRRDGLIEIRRASWPDLVVNRETAGLCALAIAWALCTVALVETLVVSPLIVGALGIVGLTILCGVPVSPCAPAPGDDGGGGHPPLRVA